MAIRRTTMRSRSGTKLYAVRDSSGKFKDIQTYKRAHAADLRHKSKAEKEAAQGPMEKKVRKAAKGAVKSIKRSVSGAVAAVERAAKRAVRKVSNLSPTGTQSTGKGRPRKPQRKLPAGVAVKKTVKKAMKRATKTTTRKSAARKTAKKAAKKK